MVESAVSDLAHDIHMHFVTNGFVWNLGGDEDEPTTPSPEDIEHGLQFAKTALATEDAGTTMFGGRLAIQKDLSGHLDVYVHFGEIDNDDTV